MTTSDVRAPGVFVHVRSANGTSRLVGRYRLAGSDGAGRCGTFAYVGSWLRDEGGPAFALDPQNLPLQAGPFLVRHRGLLPGVLADTTPDRWGRRLVAVAHPELYPAMTAEDWLLATGDERVGCLAFSRTPEPPDPSPEHAVHQDLAAIGEGFERLMQGEPAPALVERLYRAGHSIGGARPKAVVAHEGALWIAKFQRTDDDYDQCAAEHATMRLAAGCGIDVAETRIEDVGPRRVILVKRFERTEDGSPYRPTAHFLSALSALGLDDSATSGSYADIARFIRRFCRDHKQDREELFRRMVFNVLCGNRDDHLKNHALLRRDSGTWSLSPAFDLVPQPDMEAIQAINVGLLGGTPTVWNCVSQCSEFGLGAEKAALIVADVQTAVRPWRDHFRRCGVDHGTIRRLEPAFALASTDRADPRG